MWHSNFAADSPTYGYTFTELSGESDSSPTTTAFYAPSSDYMVIDSSGENSDPSNATNVNQVLESWDINHEYGHVRLCKSSDIFDRIFTLNARNILRFQQFLEEYKDGEAEIIGDDYRLDDLLKPQTGIQTFQDHWRPVQETYATVQTAYANPIDTGIALSTWIDQVETDLQEMDGVSVSLSNPPRSVINSDLMEVRKHRLEYQRVMLTAIYHIHQNSVFSTEEEFMRLIQYVTAFASRDTDSPGSWKAKVPREFFESILALYRLQGLVDFTKVGRETSPRSVAQHIRQLLGFSLPEERDRKESLVDTLDGIMGDNPDINKDDRDFVVALWEQINQEINPICIKIFDSNMNHPHIISRYGSQEAQEFVETSEIVRELHSYCLSPLFPSDYKPVFTNISAPDHYTDTGTKYWNITTEICSEIEHKNLLSPIFQNHIKDAPTDW